MKRILFFCLLLLSFLANAQVGKIPQYLGNSNTSIRARGDFLVDSAFGIPNRDTNFIPRFPMVSTPMPGVMVRRPQDGKLYYYDTIGVDQWKKVADTSDLPFLSVGKKATYDTTGKVYFVGGVPKEVKLKPFKFEPRFGAELLNQSDDTSLHYIQTPNVVGVSSVAQMRSTLSGVTITDTQFSFRLTNYARNYLQDYQYDPNDVTSVDNGATIIKSGTKVFRAVFPSSLVNVRIFGATGDGSTDDHNAIQAGIDAIIANPKLPRNLYFQKGIYRITAPLIVYKWDGTDYQFCSVNFIGQEAAHFTDMSQEAIIDASSITQTFALGFQRARASKVKGICIIGSFNPAFTSDYRDWYNRSYATFASAYGYRDTRFSPNAGIVFDPFYFSSALPPDGGYPGLSSWYRGTGTFPSSGSSGITIEDCRVYGFTVDVILSPNGSTQEAENIILNKCALEYAKAAYATCQFQTKNNFIYNMISWSNVHTLIDGSTWGSQTGLLPNVLGTNSAGNVIRVVHAGAQFPTVFMNIFCEALYEIGDMSGGPGAVSFLGCHFDFNPNTTPYFIPPYHFFGRNVKFKDCTMRFYDDLFNKRLYFKGNNISFDNCFFDLPPLGQDEGFSQQMKTLEFKDCYWGGGSDNYLGQSTFSGKIDATNNKIAAYGNITLQTTKALTLDVGHFHEFTINLRCGGLQRYQRVGGSITVTVDTTARTASLTLNSTYKTLVAVGDYILSGSNGDELVGRVSAVNRSTGVVSVVDVPAGYVTNTPSNIVFTYYDVLTSHFVGDVTQGTNTILNTEFGGLLAAPYVGQRVKIGYRGAVIDGISGSTITMSDNALYTKVHDYSPIYPQEKIDITSIVYDPSNAAVASDLFLFPEGAVWHTLPSFTQTVQQYNNFIFTQGGYISPGSIGKTLQAIWKRKADESPAYFSIDENGNINVTALIKWDANTQVANNSGAIELRTQNGAPKFTVSTTGATFNGNVAYQSVQTITTTSAVTIGNTINTVVVDPPSTLATLPITMPASPVDGEEERFVFGGTVTSGAVVTALTISANSGQALIQVAAPTTANAGDCFIYQYKLSNTKWYRIK